MAEIEWMRRHRRPGLAAAAVALAEILDNPRAVSSQPAAAKVLVALLENRVRRQHVAVAAIWRWFGH
jgi:hypothetical protein